MNPPSHPTIASIQSVSKRFDQISALNNLDLQLKSGEVLGILGPNGAGKTTLINLLLGKLSLTTGNICIFGFPPGDIKAKRLCGAMLQVASLPETLTIKEHIQLFQSYYASPMDYQQVINYAGLHLIQNKLSKSLSGGQTQRLLFALAICGNPKLLFLDEPSVGMDIESRQNLWLAIKALRDQGTSIVLTTHYLEEADKLSDRIVMLNNGRIIQQGTPESIKSLVRSQKIRFVSGQAIEMFADIQCVIAQRKNDRFIELETSNPVVTLKDLFQRVNDISDLTVSSTALEDAFLQLNRLDDVRLSQKETGVKQQSAA